MNQQGRRRKKSGGHGCLIVALVVLLILVIVAGVGAMWVNNEVKGNRKKGTEPVTTIVEKGSGPMTIGKLLVSEGIIQNAQIFRFYVGQKNQAETLQYGEFTFTPDMSYDAIIETLQATNQDRDTVTVTFPEGITATQFAKRVEEAGLCTAAEFLDAANNGNYSQYSFWAKREISPDSFMACEGFLFPDTYEFFADATPTDIVSKIYGEFEAKFTPEMYARLEELGMTLSQFVTLASIVQEEAGGADHQADVAGVFMNRLAPGSPVDKLESNCASYLQKDEENNYIYNTIAPHYGGWDLIPENIIANYDTYQHVGLPAGPISNPGLDALTNTMYYTEGTPYYFFLTDKAGKYYYAVTASEHVANDYAAQAVNASLAK